MKYRELNIQTQREAPSNARSAGFAFLVRAGYLTRENLPTPLGEHTLRHLRDLAQKSGFLAQLNLPTYHSGNEIFFPLDAGPIEVAHCPACQYAERLELARFGKTAGEQEEPLALEKVATPDSNTIEALAIFLGVAKEKTAKALMFTRASDSKFVFVVVRGDMQLSEAKLRAEVGEIRAATQPEIDAAGAAMGYASPIGLKDALIVVDDLIPHSHNLVAGANESGYHLMNTNYGRDYAADIVADLVQARASDSCPECGSPLDVRSALHLATRSEYDLHNLLLALAETHHDDKGLALPHPAAPFGVYLMHIPGKELDTRARAEEIHQALEGAGVTVMFDDRDERAGVKFNDADLIGSPVRVTVGEKALKDGMVELKPRTGKENQRARIEDLIQTIQSLLT